MANTCAIVAGAPYARMKTKTLSALALATALLCGCSSPGTFTEYHGSEIFQGAGGEVRSVDGIDFWENGEPDRRYVILGIIGEAAKPQPPLGHLSQIFQDSGGSSDRDSAIAKVAHHHGGDAVIITTKLQAPSDKAPSDAKPQRVTTLAVVRYVE
jgi:hypothetical protein